ncbi:glycosyltransferase family 2 protein [Patescibacteria group bacterium]|nr:glycosyltransferase family 2 protein [Patescibacteria group bacterium]
MIPQINLKKLIKRERIIQMIPGLMLWGSIIILFVLSFTYPILVIYLVIFYIVLFIYQSITMLRLVFRASKKIDSIKTTDWIEKLEREFGDTWQEYYQTLIIPIANEDINILKHTIESAKNIIYPKEKKILILATEKKFPNGNKISKILKEEYKDYFGKIIITIHSLKDGEIAGKASNENFAARFFYKSIKEENIDPKKVIVTSNDSDYRHEKHYFAYLTYEYLKTDNGYNKIFQPIPMFYNNIWKVPIFSRIIATFAAQWQMAITFKPERFMNFSCYAVNLEALSNAGFWDTNIIPEDERLFWKFIIAYGEDTKVIPLYIPVYGDAVLAKTYWQSIKEQYKQLRRWAWGASELTFSIPNISKHKSLSPYKKFQLLFEQLRNIYERAMAPIIITFGDLIPELNPHYQKLTLSYTIPSLLARIMTVLTIFVVLLLYFEAKFAPVKSEKTIFKKAFSYASWITYPIVSIILSSIPAIDAQTRMFFGKGIQYTPTSKKT